MQVTDAIVEAGCIGMYGKNWNGPPDKQPGEAMKNVWRKYARDCLTAALAEMWRPVSEAEPNRTYLLGWHDWRDHAWCTEVAPAIHGQHFENGYSNVSQHGSATHFMPLPAPPMGK